MTTRLSRCLLVLACFAAVPSAVESSEEGDPPPWWISEFFRAVPQEAPDDLTSGPGQTYMQLLPAVGREDRHVARQDWPIRAKSCDAQSEHRAPIEAITELARETRIVIVNEAHDRPRHRDFIRQVAIALRPQGYTRFAAETFRDSVSEPRDPLLPLVNDGFYANEPVFGQLLRDVLAHGYRLEAYEYRGMASDSNDDAWTRADRREEAQAENLTRILESMNAEERILIHAGYSHAAEVPIRGFGGREIAWMAARLREKTGINPLTIDQTGCESTQGATVLTVASDRYVEGQFDLVVGHPPLTFESGRPTWRARGRSSVEVPAELRSETQRVLIEARSEGEPSTSVPVDRLMLWPGEDLPLLLKDGRYTLSAWFESTGEFRIEILVVD